jgi:arabinofuranan 3-O-arabinosyltransferase
VSDQTARPEKATDPVRPRAVATSALRQVGYAAILTAFAFSQSAGQVVADTKFDLVTGPARFLRTGLRLWDPSAAFGQLQNQAYGYAWPMGPFFLLGDLVQLPPWVVQRLWWALLLCAAFFGVLRLARTLGLGTPGTQVLAAFAFVLTPRITTLLGGVSVELWPMALAPWVLVPLVRASERGSLRRAAAVSALVIATCGGVNAIAVAAVLPLGVVFILTRGRGPRRWRLLGWWTLFTGLATAWWWLPLVLLGRYSVPFLDYIENATITTVPTDLTRTLVGESDWVAYFAGIDFQAGQKLVTTPFLMLDAAAVVALGLVGIALRDNPHRRFLSLGLLTGVVLVGFGYAGDLSGFFAADRTAALDGVLAPLRNLHKFDVVLRLPLVLGLAHAMAALPRLLRTPDSPGASRGAVFAVRAMAVLVLAGLALPWLQDRIAPRQGVDEVPAYWYQAADYLADHDDGSVALELPATSFGVYTWGNTHDDVLQGLAESPWAVRNVIPLAQPGNVVFLDAVTRAVESGTPSPTLAPYLSANGVGRLVVRNDLDRFQTGAPDPAVVRAVLEASPGITLARSFGPTVGAPASTRNATDDGDVRVVASSGLSLETGSIDVYEVATSTRGGSGSAGDGLVTTAPKIVVGDPSAGLRRNLQGLGAGTGVVAEDAEGYEGGQVLTDTTQRRESNFAVVRRNVSATMGAAAGYRLPGPEHTRRFLDDEDRWQTTEAWAGQVGDVLASSSQAYADGRVPLEIGSHPAAALDGDDHTAWRSSAQLDPTGQFWQVSFVGAQQVPSVTVRMASDSAEVPELALLTGAGPATLVAAPEPGESRTYALGGEPTDFLRITAAGRDLELPGSFGLAEVRVGEVAAQRLLQLPEPDDRYPVDLISLARDPDLAACLPVGRSLACDDALGAPGEDGDTLARRLRLANPDTYRLTGTVSLRRHLAGRSLTPDGPAAASGVDDATQDVGRSPSAAIDGDRRTTWVSASDDAQITVTLPEQQTVHRLRLQLDPAAPASRPTEVLVSSGDLEATVSLDAQGRGDLPSWDVRTLTVRITEVETAANLIGGDFSPARSGISELTINGHRLLRLPGAPVAYPCGSGPTIAVGDRVIATALRASVSDLVRGTAVPFEPCTRGELPLEAGVTDVIAPPSGLFRVDPISLARTGAAAASAEPFQVHRDADGLPRSASLPARSDWSVVSLPQNFNDGWEARAGDVTLEPQRVDGWKQGWVLGPGGPAEVTFTYQPTTLFTGSLVAGGVGVLICLLCALLPGRRRHELPALAEGRVGLLDLAVVLVAGGLLAGVWGLAGFGAAVAVGLLTRRRTVEWGTAAALAMVLAGLGLSWDRINEADWANDWRQGWSLAAIAFVVAALAARWAGRRQRPRRRAAEGPPETQAREPRRVSG